MIPRAQPDGGQRRAAHADKGAESGNHHDDRQGHAHAGQRHIPYAWNVADIDAVYNIIEHIDDLSRHAGQAELKQGYYDYMFAVVPSKEKKPDLVTMQNNFYQTPDEYNIRFYMYDYNVMCFRLLGYQTVGAKPMGS